MLERGKMDRDVIEIVGIHTSLQLFSESQSAHRRKSPVKVENRLLL